VEKVSTEGLNTVMLRKLLGGVGYAAQLLYDEIPADTDPLSPENKLIFATGPLTGTPAPSSSRYTVMGKSPLTGTWGDANSGGFFGPALKKKRGTMQSFLRERVVNGSIL